MKFYASVLSLLFASASLLSAKTPPPTIAGDYLEVRTCDVYTGPCFANAEMGLAGKEGMLVWSVREGAWNGTRLDGLKVIAVVHTDATLGDVRYQPRQGRAVLIVDAKADARQRQALQDMARALAGELIYEVAEVRTAPIEARLAACDKAGCASVKAGDLVQINTRCLGENDHLCGNEDTFYPPLTQVTGAFPVYTELAGFQGRALNATWQATGQRSAFLASFAR